MCVCARTGASGSVWRVWRGGQRAQRVGQIELGCDTLEQRQSETSVSQLQTLWSLMFFWRFLIKEKHNRTVTRTANRAVTNQESGRAKGTSDQSTEESLTSSVSGCLSSRTWDLLTLHSFRFFLAIRLSSSKDDKTDVLRSLLKRIWFILI